jgi:hypothetical protein
LNTAAIHMLRKVGLAVMGNPSDDELRAFKAELQKLRNRDLKPGTQLSAPLRIAERIPLSEADTV